VDGAAALVTAIASLVTALGSATAAIIIAVRSSGRQREQAAGKAAELATASRPPSHKRHKHAKHGDPDDVLTARLKALAELGELAEKVADDLTDDGGDGD
jgi:hypothetical protein